MKPVNEVRYECLYTLTDPFAKRFARGRVRLPPDLHPNRLLRGETQPACPLMVQMPPRGTVGDFVWTGEVALVLMSGRVVGALRRDRVTGWSTYPVRLEGIEAADTPMFFGLQITGRCGPLDRSRGEWVHKDDEPGKQLRGLFFEETSWDGSDFFIPSGSLHIFVSERVKECLKREKVTNARLERLIDVLTPEVVLRNTRR